MLAHASRPFIYSTLLHASVAGLVLILMLLVRPEPASEPPVVVMVSDSLFTSVVHDAPARPPAAPAVTFTPARVEPVPERRSLVQSQAVERTPVPTRNRVAVAPERPMARQTTLAEHGRLHPTQNDSGRVASATPAPRINVDDVLAVPATNAPRPSTVADAALVNSFLERLVAQLRDAHEKPAGLDEGLQARVEFVLRADGVVADARILQSSGDAVFDASVLAAFRRLRDLGRPPAGMAGVKQITFRTRVE